ncbi:MAG TPA: hypothetical protein PKD86_13320 [Gemmatales bacterium]|nr:hypothetical protein [Gemmatales bacterium]HMP60321.1 hypothetical protein [Gemmatales bacterium]
MAAFDLEAVLEHDARYPREAYDFLLEALAYTQRRLGRAPDAEQAGAADHVSARELLEGIRDHAVAEFGLMAPTVFRQWGVERTGDIGNLVFNLIAVEALACRPEERREDFEDVFDLNEELLRDFTITLEEVEP